MAEMIACYVLSTWLLDAFNVCGFVWPNGDRGSGKTQLITLIAELSYLGEVILAGGSFAALRDLADYGALLAFDDAENLGNPKLTDPDKRALLLAGNRRGATVPLKELTADKTWRTRHVNAFCPRCFSAIRLPDAVLASRTIVVPLIRTANRAKGNADVKDWAVWPHDCERLIDDLWAVGLRHLSALRAFEAVANRESALVGRNLEPWRAILAVARWLDELGAEGLWGRMDRLSLAYQAERPELETSDITVLVLKALRRLARKQLQDEARRDHGADSADRAVGAVKVASRRFFCATKLIRESFDVLAEEDEIDTSWMGEAASRHAAHRADHGQAALSQGAHQFRQDVAVQRRRARCPLDLLRSAAAGGDDAPR